MRSVNAMSQFYFFHSRLHKSEYALIDDLRTIWVDEARDFTPWLVKKENLKLLSEKIGIKLEFVSAETFVGGFRADVVCKNIFDK